MADKEFESKPQENTKTTGISDNPQRTVSEVEKNIDVNGIGAGLDAYLLKRIADNAVKEFPSVIPAAR